MSKHFKIISNDAKFVKMLSLTLLEYGLSEASNGFPESDIKDRFIIVDLDFCDSKSIKDFSEVATLVGFTKAQAEDNPFCAVIFKRPFHMSDFLDFLGDNERPISYIREKRTENHKKPHFLTVSEDTLTAMWGDMKISLSENEYKVLKLLCERRGEIVEREKVDALLGVTEGNMSDVYICHLRRKIDNKLGLKLIYTVRGKGYMLKN